MIYRFTIISDEVDDFVREIQIDPEATFFDFHEAILKSVGYFHIYVAGNKVYGGKLLYIVKKQYFSVVFHEPENV